MSKFTFTSRLPLQSAPVAPTVKAEYVNARLPRVAFVFGGGGSKGSFQVGVVRYLYEKGITPEIVCGTSTGSITALLAAQGKEGAKELERQYRELKSDADMYEQEPWLKELLELKDQPHVAAANLLLRQWVATSLTSGHFAFPITLLNLGTAGYDLVTKVMKARAVFNLGPVRRRLRSVPWSPIPGTSQAKRMATAVNADGRLELFLLQADGRLAHARQTTPGGAWAPVQQMESQPGVDFVVGKNQDGRLEAFLLLGTGVIDHCSQSAPNADWGDWTSLGRPGQVQETSRASGTFIKAAVSQIENAPAIKRTNLVVLPHPDGRLSLITLDSSGRPWQQEQQAPNGSWGTWRPLGDSNLEGVAITAAPFANGYLALFLLTDKGEIRHATQVGPHGSLSPWSSLGNPSLQAPAGTDVDRLPGAGRILVLTNEDKRLELFFSDPFGRTWHRWEQSPNGAWSDWAVMGSEGRPAGAIVGNRTQDGRLELFRLNRYNHVERNVQAAPNSGWEGWSLLDPEFSGEAKVFGVTITQSDPVSQICVGQNLDGRQAVFISMPPSVAPVLHTTQLTPHGWSHSERVRRRGVKLRLSAVSLKSGLLHYVSETGQLIRCEPTGPDETKYQVVPGVQVDITDGVLASASVPGAFPPIHLQTNDPFTDGGVREMLPLKMAIDLGGEVIYAVPCSKPNLTEKGDADKDIIAILRRVALDIMPDEIGDSDIAMGKSTAKLVLIQPQIEVHDTLTINSNLIDLNISYGYMRAADIVEHKPDPKLHSNTSRYQQQKRRFEAIEANTLQLTQKRLEILNLAPSVGAAAPKLLQQLKQQLSSLLQARRQLGGKVPPEVSDWV